MKQDDAVQELQHFILEHGLPKLDLALFGVRCPYCGKSDRIRELPRPDELQGQVGPDAHNRYSDLWLSFERPAGVTLGVCKFCHNPLKISVQQGKAGALFE